MDFVSVILSNPHNRIILERLPNLQVGECWLVAGCLAQSYWNWKSGNPLTAQIKDYDIFYYDQSDLSYEAEDRVIKRGDRLFADLNLNIEIRNQARVPLWFKEKYGIDYPSLHHVTDGISRFQIKGSCIGLTQGHEEGYRLYAPYGLDDTEQGVLRSNPVTPNPEGFLAKARSYQERWPWLKIVT